MSHHSQHHFITWLAFLNFTENFINIVNKKPRGQLSDVIVPAFLLSGKRKYVVEEFSAERQRGIISWDNYLTT